MSAVCPNCEGELVRRPRREDKELQGDDFVTQDR
jgi:hypothetical protein